MSKQYDPQELLINGDIHGQHSQAKLIERYALYDCCGNDLTDLPRAESEYYDTQSYEEASDHFNDRIYACGVFTRLAGSDALWPVEWRDGSIWAIHPEAEWCDTCEQYYFGLDYYYPGDACSEYLISKNFAVSLINDDPTCLDDEEYKALNDWVKDKGYLIQSPGCACESTEFLKCEVTGLMADCISMYEVTEE